MPRVSELPLTGGCLCGTVRFEVTERPLGAGYCHCTRCQRRTGTASSVQARLAPGSLRITQGERAIRAFVPEQGAEKLFCGECGSALWSRSQDEAQTISVRLSAFDADPGIPLSYRQFVADAAPWETIPDDGLPRFEERRPPGVG
jgi:hypothetical protein